MKIHGWSAAALLITGALATTASAVEIHDFAREGGTFRDYPVTGVPLLDSFYFRFVRDQHHIESISVEPASPIPDPCVGCAAVPPGMIFLTLQDEGRDDEYEFRISHAEWPVNVQRHRFTGNCTNFCREQLAPKPRDSIFVITGFTFFFIGGDHRLSRIALWERGGHIFAHFADDNGDDRFRYELEYVYLPESMIPIRGHESGEQARGAVSVPIDLGPVMTGPTVLRGFDLEFLPDPGSNNRKDREIREIGIRTPGRTLEVYYSDNDQGAFNWNVQWGALPRVPVPNPDPPRR